MFYDISTHFLSVYSIGTNSDLVPKDVYVSSILPHSTQYDNRHTRPDEYNYYPDHGNHWYSNRQNQEHFQEFYAYHMRNDN